jgi:hypothetical protein
LAMSGFAAQLPQQVENATTVTSWRRGLDPSVAVYDACARTRSLL